MITRYAFRLLALASLAPLPSTPVLAQEGGYCCGGLGAGTVRARLNAGAITREQTGTAATTVVRDDRDITTSLSVATR